MNRLLGAIDRVETEGGLTIAHAVSCDMEFIALLVETPESCPYLKRGKKVEILFKETEVSIAKNLSGLISLSARFSGAIDRIREGGLLTEVAIDANGAKIVSIITTASAKRLALAAGDRIEWLVKANEISLRAAETEAK